MVAESVTLLDAARGIVYAAAKTVDSGLPHRRMVSEAKKFATDAAWEISNMSLRIMGGIGYTTVYPVERLVRDARLIQIWTGTNEVMSQIIQHEYYQELLNLPPGRDLEKDAYDAEGESEKCFTDEDMWRGFDPE